MDEIDEMVGKNFGSLFVLSRVDNINNHRAYLCQCDCGVFEVCVGSYLRTGLKSKCKHCNNRESLDYLLGNKIGKWSIIFPTDVKNKYVCQCECGEVRSIRGRDLINGKSMSCGCGKRRINI